MRTSEDRRPCLLAVAAFAIGLVVALPMVFMPLHRDHGFFAYGADVILDGGVPYRDFHCHQAPAIYYIYAAAFRLLGRAMASPRIADLIAQIATFLLIYHIGKNAGRATAGVISALLFCLWYHSFFWFSTARVEGFAAPIAAAVLFFSMRLARKPTPRDAAITGFLLGVLIWFKPTFLCIGASTAIALAVTPRPRPPRQLFNSCLWLALGGMAAFLPPFLYFEANGGLIPMWERVVVFNARFYASITRPRSAYHALLLASPLDWNALLGFSVISVAGIAIANDRTDQLITAGAIIGSLAALAIQGTWFGYQWIIPAMFLSILAGYGVSELIRCWNNHGSGLSHPIANLALTLFLLCGSEIMIRNLSVLESLARGQNPAEMLDRIDLLNATPFTTVRRLADFASRNTSPEQTILVWGMDPLVYFLAGRKSPTKFSYQYPLVTPGDHDLMRKFQDDFMKDFETRLPQLIFIADNDKTLLMPLTSRESLIMFPRLLECITKNYAPVGQIGNYAIYARISGAQ